jgi:hypothetical protein
MSSLRDGFFRCTEWRSVAGNVSCTFMKGVRVFVASKLSLRREGGDVTQPASIATSLMLFRWSLVRVQPVPRSDRSFPDRSFP